MNTLQHTPHLLKAARHIIWFEPPETALTDTTRVLAYAFTYTTPHDMGLTPAPSHPSCRRQRVR